MDDNNTDTITSTTGSTTNTTDSTVKAPQVADSEKTVNEPTPTPTSTVNEPTPISTGGGENTNMANDTTTKKVDPKFDGCQTYVVVKGDALVDIADKFGVGLNQLRYFNGVPKATFKISEGQTIYIPKGEVKVPVGA